MVVILHRVTEKTQAEAIREQLIREYPGAFAVILMEAESATEWPGMREWDDLIILPFSDNEPLPACCEGVLREELARGRADAIVPVALVGSHHKPPEPIDHIKAQLFFQSDGRDSLVSMVGALLFLRFKKKDTKIFVSYRAADGEALARQLAISLKDRGFAVFMDKIAEESDDDDAILPGSSVPEAIEQRLNDAEVVLLVDTPRVASSRWVKTEVNHANARQIPVFPVIFLAPGEKRQTSRLRSLACLGRGWEFPAENGAVRDSLSAKDLDSVVEALQDYLADIFKRRKRLPFLVEVQFKHHRYSWRIHDHLTYESICQWGDPRPRRVLTHCSCLSGVSDWAYLPLIRHLDAMRPPADHSLYAYDGIVLDEDQIDEDLDAEQRNAHPKVHVFHHEEVSLLLQSNFTLLRRKK